MQIHINGDVMMAIKQYLYATGDLLWLEHEGAPHPPRASVCTRSLTHRLTRPPSSLPYSVPPVLSLPLPPALLFVPDGCEPSSLPPPNRNGALVKPSTATQPLAGHDACLVIAAALSYAVLRTCLSAVLPLVFHLARFWASRVHRGADGLYHIGATPVRSNAGEKRQFARVAMRLGRSTHALSAGSGGCVCACAACVCVSACVAANVVSADEYAINVTDSVYTNAIASLSLQVRSALSPRSNRSTNE